MTQAAIPQLMLKWNMGKLNTIDLDRGTLNTGGVYAIGYVSRKNNRKTLRAGQSDVLRRRLEEHLNSVEIRDYATRHQLDVAWAHVDADHRDGVEAYLGRELNPKLGDRYPDAQPILVNLPW